MISGPSRCRRQARERILGLFLLLISANACTMAQTDDQPRPEVDIPRYMGTWHEVARLPNRFQQRCVGDVTATYTLRSDGTITVVNRCRKENEKFMEAAGRARLAGKDGPASRLEVRFAPGWLGWLPFVWAEYWIIHLDAEHRHAIVGGPSRKYLWILAREASPSEGTMQDLITIAARHGYAVEHLVR
jgi:apolipoprotein D and lipocalin family protein